MRDTTSNGSRLGRCASNSAFVCGDGGHVLSHPLTLADGPSVLPCLRSLTSLRPMRAAFQVRLSAHCMPDNHSFDRGERAGDHIYTMSSLLGLCTGDVGTEAPKAEHVRP